MNAAIVPQPTPNIVALPQPKRKQPERFSLVEFTNRSGTQSWRVSGTKRDGSRVRKNFSDAELATAHKSELELEYLGSAVAERTTKTLLPDEKLRLAEMAFMKLGDDWERILDAIDHWKTHGRRLSVTDSPRIDDAVAEYLKWLDATPTLRDATKKHWKTRITVFGNSVPN